MQYINIFNFGKTQNLVILIKYQLNMPELIILRRSLPGHGVNSRDSKIQLCRKHFFHVKYCPPLAPPNGSSDP
jgi:hypothetical protein